MKNCLDYYEKSLSFLFLTIWVQLLCHLLSFLPWQLRWQTHSQLWIHSQSDRLSLVVRLHRFWPLRSRPPLCTGEGAGAKEVVDGLPFAGEPGGTILHGPARHAQTGQCNTQTHKGMRHVHNSVKIHWLWRESNRNLLIFCTEVASWMFTNIAFSTLGSKEWDDFITWRGKKQILMKFLPRN